MCFEKTSIVFKKTQMANSIYYLMCIAQVEIHKKLDIAKDTFQACGRGGTSWSAMIKDLAVAVFGRSMLATHSLSGKTGNANKESQPKPPLDPKKVALIIGIKLLKLFN